MLEQMDGCLSGWIDEGPLRGGVVGASLRGPQSSCFKGEHGGLGEVGWEAY